MIRKNVIAKSGRAIEAAGDIDVLLIDKTGTITLGNRMATAFLRPKIFTERFVAESAQLASLADETPEGRSMSYWLKKNLIFVPRIYIPSNLGLFRFPRRRG